MILHSEAALSRVIEVARDVRSSPVFLERMEQTHAALAEVLRANVFSCWVFDPQQPARLLTSHGLMRGREPRLDEYVAQYRFEDPMSESFSHYVDKVFLLSDWIRGEQFGRDAFTGEFLPTQDIRHVLGVSKRLPGGLVLASAFHRGASSAGDFVDADRELVARASDHIARAAFGAMLREKVAGLLASEPSGAVTGAGALIFDAFGDVVHADARALSVLRDLEALGALEALSDDAVGLALQPPGTPLERRCALSRSRSLLARLASFALTGGERGVLVSLVEEELDPIEARLVRAGLTPRERTIARRAAEGLGSEGIAFELGIAPTTVTVHLTRIFRKTGVTGRVGLTRWLHAR